MTAFTLELIGLAAVMSVVIAFLLVFLKLFGKLFTAKCRYIIWAALILRLCIPVGLIGLTPIFELSVPENVSLPRTASVTQIHVPDNPVEPVTPPETVKTPVQPEPSPSPAAPKTEVHSNVQPTVGGKITADEKPAVTPEVKRSTEKTLDVKKLLPTVGMIWLAVSGAILFVRLVSYTVYTARLSRRGAFREADGELLDIYLTLGRDMKIKRLPKLSVTEYKTNPFLYGFISPRIVLPETVVLREDVREILAHELTHYKRGDIYIKLACTAAKSLNFFNPLAYAASDRCVRAQELSCDEAVLKNCNEEERLEYGNAMLGIVSTLGHVRSSELTSSFNPKHGALKERIMNICDTSKKKRGIIITAAVLVVCIFAGSIVGATMIKDVDRGNNSKETENPAVVMTTEDTTAETEPETTVPETTVPETKVPETKAPETTAVPEPVTEPEELMPYGDYVGIWYVNETMEDTIGVYSCSENEIEFTTGIFRTFGFRDTAKYSDGAYRFGDGVSNGYWGPAGISGTISLLKDGILVTYDSFGDFYDAAVRGNRYYFSMKQDLLIPPDVPLGMTSIPPELWTFYDDDFYDRKEGLIEQLKTRQMRDTNGSDIYITIETDPRMFVDGSLDTIDDFVALIPDKYKDMFSCAGLVGVYPAQHIVSVWWSLTLKNEYSEYIDQIMSDFLNKDCVVGFDVSAFYYEGLCTSTEVVWRYIYGVDYKANEIYF